VVVVVVVALVMVSQVFDSSLGRTRARAHLQRLQRGFREEVMQQRVWAARGGEGGRATNATTERAVCAQAKGGRAAAAPATRPRPPPQQGPARSHGGSRTTQTSALLSPNHLALPHPPIVKMREIVHIQAGQCGNQIGASRGR